MQLGWMFISGDIDRLRFGQQESPAAMDIEIPNRENKL